MRERLEVRIHDEGVPRVVGELVDVGTGPHFQYAQSFLQGGIELSPLQLALDTRVFPPGPTGLHRLQGLFFDSTPDGWGLKLLHQAMREAGLDVTRSSAVTWLRALGTHGMGALTFHPPMNEMHDEAGSMPDLAKLAEQARAVEADHVEHVLPALSRAGGSSGGARPKIVAGWHESGAIVDAFVPLPPGYRHALIKFAARSEPKDAPLVEAAYLAMAKLAGLEVTAHRIHTLPKNRWALIVDRFDRVADARRHVHTLAGLLALDIRYDFVDYQTLVKVALRLTNDFRVVAAAWQRAAFNVGANNRDDHARNVAFLMSPNGTWGLAPAYDLTYSEGPGGYHTMAVAGESRSPGRTDLLRVADGVGLSRREAERGLEQVRAALDEWPRLATSFGVSRSRIRTIGVVLSTQSAVLAP